MVEINEFIDKSRRRYSKAEKDYVCNILKKNKESLSFLFRAMQIARISYALAIKQPEGMDNQDGEMIREMEEVTLGLVRVLGMAIHEEIVTAEKSEISKNEGCDKDHDTPDDPVKGSNFN